MTSNNNADLISESFSTVKQITRTGFNETVHGSFKVRLTFEKIDNLFANLKSFQY